MTILVIFGKITVPVVCSLIGGVVGLTKAIVKPIHVGNSSIAPAAAMVYVATCTTIGLTVGLISGLIVDVIIF